MICEIKFVKQAVKLAVLERRRVQVACIQETRWKGAKTRELGSGNMLFYHGPTKGKNGVGIILCAEWKTKVITLQRQSDRLMAVKLTTESGILNVVSTYAPQQGCMEDDKEEFRVQLEAMIRSIPEEEDLMIGVDLNRHVGEEAGYKE